MIKLNKLKNYPIIYILTVLFLSFSFINFYSLRIKVKKQINEPGFRFAISVKNDANICLIDNQDLNCPQKIINDFKNNESSILFLGNSQTGAINKYKNGDESYISILNKIYSGKSNKLNLKSFWFPNANLKEFEVVLETINKCQKDIKVLFLPVFLDDTRNKNIREELVNFGEKTCENLNSNVKKDDNHIGNIYYLNKKIQKNLEIFQHLKSLNENIRIDIYKLRNFVFNINPSSVRPIKKTTYDSNLNSLKKIIKGRSKKKFITIIYIPPLLNSNSEGAIPYDLVVYKNFKLYLKNICNNKYCYFFNLEQTVPNKYWGLKRSTTIGGNLDELDYMHFTGEGHIRLANKFKEIIDINNFHLYHR